MNLRSIAVFVSGIKTKISSWLVGSGQKINKKVLSSSRLYRKQLLVSLGIAFLALSLRWTVALGIPTLFTADSPSYLTIASDFLTGNSDPDFRLGTLRLPLYPLFLSLLLRLPLSGDAALALGQSLLGTVAVLAVFTLARGLGASLPAALIPTFFVSFSPPYLLFERAVMTESLCLTLLLSFAAVSVRWAHKPQSFFRAGVAGGLAGLLLLTRLNYLPFLLFLLLPVGSTLLRSGKKKPTALRPALGALLFSSAVAFAVLAPWILWIHKRFGTWSLHPSSAKIRLVYATQHKLLDPQLELERLQAAGIMLRNASPPLQLFWALSQLPDGGEARAEALLKQAYHQQPEAVLVVRKNTVLLFLGVSQRVSEPVSWLTQPSDPQPPAERGSRTILSRSDTVGRHFLVEPLLIVTTYYEKVRWLLPAVAASALVLTLLKRRQLEPLTVFGAFLLSLSFTATVALHTWALANYPRFTLPLDWIPFLLLCLALTAQTPSHRMKIQES